MTLLERIEIVASDATTYTGRGHIVNVPKCWQVVQRGGDGLALKEVANDLRAIITVGVEFDGLTWLHLSLSSHERIPSYEEMCYAKSDLIGEDIKAIQVFAPRAEHVNINPHVLHLWACLDGDPLPDFTRGRGTI